MRNRFMLCIGLVVGVSSWVAAMQNAPIKANGAIELKDPAGDVGPLHSSSGDEPPLDVVLFGIKSDGKKVTFTVTLNNLPGSFATAPVTVYIDTDNNPATGTKSFAGEPGGFEYRAEVSLCMKYNDQSEACSGGSTKGKVTERYGAMNLDHFKSSDSNSKETIIDNMGFPGSKASPKTPVTGKVVEASFDYADIKAKSGQTIRLWARETGGNAKTGDGSFPIVLLTLK